MMKKLAFAMLLCCSAIYCQAQDEYAKEILDRMSEKYRNIPSYKVNFTYLLENKMENIHEQFEGEIIIKGEKYKLILSDQMVYNDGETLYTYLVDANEVNIDHYVPDQGDLSPKNIYNAYKQGYKYRFLEEEQQGSRVYNVIELQPEDPNDPDKIFYKVVLYIDKADDLIHSWKMYDRAGNVFTYTIKGFDPTFKAEDEMFVFDESEFRGVEVVDLR